LHSGEKASAVCAIKLRELQESNTNIESKRERLIFFVRPQQNKSACMDAAREEILNFVCKQKVRKLEILSERERGCQKYGTQPDIIIRSILEAIKQKMV